MAFRPLSVRGIDIDPLTAGAGAAIAGAIGFVFGIPGMVMAWIGSVVAGLVAWIGAHVPVLALSGIGIASLVSQSWFLLLVVGAVVVLVGASKFRQRGGVGDEMALVIEVIVISSVAYFTVSSMAAGGF